MSNISVDFANFMSTEAQIIFKEYLGPNWRFHTEQELKARNPDDYVYLDEYPLSEREERAKIVAEMVSKLETDVFFGQNIVSDAIMALYSWKPEFFVRDELEKHPDAKVNRLKNGQPYKVGYHSIPHDTTEQREKSWNCSESIMRTQPVLCGACADKLPPPPRPPLARQDAELPHYAHEKYQVRCDHCNKKMFMMLTFSTDPVYYSYYNFN